MQASFKVQTHIYLYITDNQTMNIGTGSVISAGTVKLGERRDESNLLRNGSKYFK